MLPLCLGYQLGPRHLLACTLGHSHLTFPILTGIIHAIRCGHVLVQECHIIGLLTLARAQHQQTHAQDD